MQLFDHLKQILRKHPPQIEPTAAKITPDIPVSISAGYAYDKLLDTPADTMQTAQALHALWHDTPAERRCDLIGKFYPQYIDRWQNFDPAVWKKHCEKPEHYRVLLMLGTSHRNGYFRERCMRYLCDVPEALPCILLRLNDWVLPIRQLARDLAIPLLRCASPALVLECCPFLEKLLRGERHEYEAMQEVLDLAVQRLLTEPDMILHLPDAQRSAVYRILLRSDMQRSDFQMLLASEKNAYLYSLLVRHYLRLHTPEESELIGLLHSRIPMVRYLAAEKRLAVYGPWEDLPELLLDKSRRIREFASYHLRKNGFGVREFYPEHLKTSAETALLGLGETGTPEDLPLIRQYLNSEQPRIAAAALTAVSHLDTENGAETLWEHLFHPELKVRRTACRIMKNATRYEQYQRHFYGSERIADAIRRTEDPVIRKFLLILLIHEPGWENLPHLLRLYGELPWDCRELIVPHLRMNPYIRIPAEEMRQVLEDTREALPESIYKSLLWEIERLS